MVSKLTYTAKYAPELNYTQKYIYKDTLLVQLVRNYFDRNTLKELISITDYTYDRGKLVGRTSRMEDGTILANYSGDITTGIPIVSSTNSSLFIIFIGNLFDYLSIYDSVHLSN